jgi:hypothetical protein
MLPRLNHRPFDAALGLFLTHLCWATVAYSQRSLVSFGPYIEFHTDKPPSTIALFNARTTPLPFILVGSVGQTGILRYTLSPGGRLLPDLTLTTTVQPGMIAPVDVNGDGTEEVVVLSADGFHVEIIEPGSDPVRAQHVRLEQRAQLFVDGDVNNDRRKDLLFFGRNMSGVATLLSAPDGHVEPGPLLFPELSASDLVTADLNGDRIADVVLLHWLSNTMVVHFGIGKGLFSEQVALQLPDEPGRIAYMPVQNRRTLRFLVTLPERKSVAHIVGTPAGEFSLKELIPLPGRPIDVSFALINDDLLPDFVASTTTGMAVALGATATTFYPVDVFGTGAESASWTLGDIDADRKTDLVIADRKRRKIIVLGNALHSSLVAWPQEYAAGIQPRALAVGDCTNDGYDDIVVANLGSSSVGVFQNTGEGMVLGQRCIAVPEKPNEVAFVPGWGWPAATLVTVHQSLEQLGITRLSSTLEPLRKMTIPTEPRPILLHAEMDSSTRRLSILVRSAQNGGTRAPLALFEEMDKQQFLERSYRFTLPTAISAMTVGSFTGTERRDLVLALRNRSTLVTTVYLAPAQEGYDFRKIQPQFSLPDSTATIRFLHAGLVNADSTTDLLLFCSEPRPSLGFAFGAPDGRLLLDSVWRLGVQPATEHDVVLEDVDADGKMDIVYLDAERDGVYCLSGLAGGRFTDPHLVVKAGGANAMAVGRLRGNSNPVVVLAHSGRHTVSIHHGVFGP